MRGYRIRIYPTKEQEQKIWRHISACRYVWNWMLDYQQKNYEAGGKYLSAFDMMNLLKPLKNDGEHDWLYEVSNTSLQIVCRDLDKAYKRFFDGASKHPKFKSRKRSKSNYPVCTTRFYFSGSACQIQKLGKVKFKSDFTFPEKSDERSKYYNVRISYDAPKWFLSFNMECENQAPELTDIPMGIDLGVKELATVAFSNEQLVYHNINKSAKMRRLERQIKHTKRTISRKYEANKRGICYVKTNNIEREEEKLRALYRRQRGIRNNYLHQVTHELVSKLPCSITVEDLSITGMMANHHLAKAVQEQCFHEFLRQIQYKAEWNGIRFVTADRFYPSSKTCSCCGNVKRDLKLSDRVYHCQECGLTIDRDYNAAINLMRYAA